MTRIKLKNCTTFLFDDNVSFKVGIKKSTKIITVLIV